ncbi:MAG: polysaccharide pyruvyl transferase family protein [Cyclobacteriaceae bacterium]
MKIGILTLSLHTNYGGILQAYALKTVLEKMGHEVWLIDTQLNQVSLQRQIWRLAKETISYLKGEVSMINPKRLRHKAYLNFTKPFIDEHIPRITKTFTSVHELRKATDKYGFHAYVVGSDQIWNAKYFKSIEVAFFSFLEDQNVIKISYAPSFGGDTWKYTEDQTRKCKELIKAFDEVSVREDVGIDFCKDYLECQASLVLDPTLLLTRDEYLKLLSIDPKSKKGGMFIYVLDASPDKKKLIEAVADKKRLVPYQLDIIEGYESSPLEWRTKARVQDWIRSFHEAEFIITDSFHGTVFSILFNKPFFVLINYERGAVRFKSILNIFNLSDRIISSQDDLTEAKLEMKIDWDKVNKILEEKKEVSLSFLKRHLYNKPDDKSSE